MESSYKTHYGDLKEYFECKKSAQLKNASGINLFKLYENFDLQKCQQIEKGLVYKPDPFFDANFKKINLYLALGNSIIFHGYGSKKTYLKLIAKRLKQLPQIEISGYDDKISLRSIVRILITVLLKLMPHEESSMTISKSLLKDEKKLQEYLLEKLQAFSQQPLKLLVIFHTLDGIKLRKPEIQKFLGKIFATKNVLLIASVENNKWLMDLGYEAICEFNPIFLQVNTVELYSDETKESVELTGTKQENAGKSLEYVLRSLSELQKEILAALSQFFDSNKDKKTINFEDFFDLCIDNMLLNNKSQLQQNLKEMIDHNILKEMQRDNNVEFEIVNRKELSQELAKDLKLSGKYQLC